MGFQKLAPGCAFASLGRGLDPVLPEDGRDRAPPNSVAQIRQGALDARVTPFAIFGRHAVRPAVGSLRSPVAVLALAAADHRTCGQ